MIGVCTLNLFTSAQQRCLLPGAYERRSREGACSPGSIQILIRYVVPFYITRRAVCHLVYFACGQYSSARKGWQHSTTVQYYKRLEVNLRRRSGAYGRRKWWSSVGVFCRSSIRVLKEGASERLGVLESSNLPRFCGKLLALSLA